MNKLLVRPKHVLLRRRDGSIRLILPAANSLVLRSVLTMYFPSRLLGKLYRYALIIWMPLQVRIGWAESAGNTEMWCTGLDQVLGTVPDAKPDYVGALISEPGPRSKLTLKIMNEKGTAFAFGRVGHTPQAMEVIRHEACMLRVLEKMPVAKQVPSLIGAGDLSSTSGCYLVETAGPEVEAGHELTPAHFEFLSGLAAGATKKWVEVVRQLEKEVAPLLEIQELSDSIALAMQWLKSIDLPDVPVVIEHGDFAPWNLRMDAHGKLYVLDWEHSRLDGLPWMDALHFVFQYSTLVLRRNSDSLIDVLREIFAHPSGFEYDVRMGRQANFANAYILIYLIRAVSFGDPRLVLSDSAYQTKLKIIVKITTSHESSQFNSSSKV